jgi:hypothetical protein
MAYRMMGRGHAALVLLAERLRAQAGQGTVEYVALILLVGTVMAAVAGFTSAGKQGVGIATKITDTLKDTINDVGAAKK